MELRQLASLAAVLDTGSFTAAARRRHLTQPALWAQIRGLEDELGVRLFARVGRGVVPTGACLALRDRVRATLADADALTTLAGELRAGRAAPARIGCAQYHVPWFLAGCIARLAAERPDVPFPTIVPVTSATATGLLDRGELDLVVQGEGPLAGREGVRLYRVWIAVVGPLATARHLDVRALDGQPIATMPADSGIRTALDAAAAAAGVAPRVIHEDRDAGSLLALARRGLCSAVLISEALPDADARRAAALTAGDRALAADLWTYWRAEAALSPAARALRDVIRAEAPAADARARRLSPAARPHAAPPAG
jgi:DNA-binding transcriptional LysR family regulator